MKMLAAAALAFASTGCTSMFKVMTDDPVRATNITKGKDGRDAVATISLDASRRNVIVGLSEGNFGQFCAEPPPDTASAIEAIVEAEAKAKSEVAEQKAEAEAKLKDSYKSSIVVIAKRTELLDIYRTGTYSLCQYYINKAIGPPELKELFESLTKSVLSRVPEQKAEVSAVQKSDAKP